MNSSIDIPFKLTDEQIDFFKLKEEYFTPAGNKVTKVELQIQSGKYLSDYEEVTDLRLTEIETTILNCQVGMGKSNAFYNLISKYSSENCIVIVCSPFKKLVSKDYNYLDKIHNTLSISNHSNIKGQKAHVCNYAEIDNWEAWEISTAAEQFLVHIMTFNCFIGNPGDNALEQKFSKAEYMDTIFQKSEGNDVILFIDEIHESIQNFQTEYIPKLLKWKNRIRKVFVASATFTPKVLPAINLLAILTNKKIRIIETKRVKQREQASIILNVFAEKNDFSGSFSSLVARKINEYLLKNKNVNIITATKSMAERIAETAFGKNVLNKIEDKPKQDINSVYLLTSDTELDYQKGENNIGTVFKTGIDIEDSNSVLFLIFPSIMEKKSYGNYYGIFSDGVSSIIQSIGRLRNGGIIEMFILEPEFKIGINSLPIIEDKKQAPYYTLNEEFEQVKIKYQQILNNIKTEVFDMERDLLIGNEESILLKAKMEFGFWYPNFHEFLLRDKRSRLLNDEPAFGKGISPYILWATLNNQFQNATLAKLIHYSANIEIIELNHANCKIEFDNLILRIEEKLSKTSFREIINNPYSYFQHIKNANGENVEIRFKCEGDTNKYSITSLLDRKRNYGKQFISSLLSFYCKHEVVFELPTYVNSCIARASDLKNNSPICQSYLNLGKIKNEFVRFCKTIVAIEDEESYLPTNIEFTKTFEQNSINVLGEVKKEDKLLYYLSYDAKNVAKKLEEYFLETKRETKSRKMIKGKIYYRTSNPFVRESTYSNFVPF